MLNRIWSGVFFWMVVWLLSVGGAAVLHAQNMQQKDVELTGTLAKTVEVGGWVLKTDQGTTYLLLETEEFQGKDWFKAGTRVRVWGHEQKDTMTFFMQGKPFAVSRIDKL